MGFYLDMSPVGSYVIKQDGKHFPLPGQRYGFLKRFVAQAYVDDLNSGRETPESLRLLWEAGERPLIRKG